jgi:hypothetical protein
LPGNPPGVLACLSNLQIQVLAGARQRERQNLRNDKVARLVAHESTGERLTMGTRQNVHICTEREQIALLRRYRSLGIWH